MSLLKKANIITTPTAYSEGKLHSVKPEIALGPELVTNGDFATDSDWAKGTGWTISGGTANCDGTNSSILRQNNLIPLNTKVKVSFTVTNYTSGSIIVKFAPTSYSVSLSGNGIYTVITDGDNTVNGDLQLLSNSFIGSIDNVSVKEDISADFDFTRGSTATRVNEAGLIESVAANLPRINYENGIGHLLLEGQRTNLIPYSNNYNLGWIQYGSSVDSTSVISPDGTLNGSKVTRGSNQTPLRYSALTTLGTEYTFSLYAKKGSIDTMFLDIGDVANAGFTLTDEWQRFTVTSTPSTFSHIDISFGTSVSGDYIYIYGAQVEAGSYPTSYIVSNSGSATTRLAETCNNAGNSDIIPSDEGVLYAEISALADDLTQRHIAISDGSDSDVVRINYHTTSNSIRGQVRAGGSIEASLTHIVPDIKDFHKVAISYKENDVKLYVDGVLILTETSASMPTGLGKLAFDNGNSINPFYGKTRMVAVFPYLSNDELECLTGEGYASFEALAAAYNYTTI